MIKFVIKYLIKFMIKLKFVIKYMVKYFWWCFRGMLTIPNEGDYLFSNGTGEVEGTSLELEVAPTSLSPSSVD